MGDLADPPRRRPEHEYFADPRFVDHLFVEFPDAATWPRLALQEHAKQPAVGDRAPALHGQPLGPRPRPQPPVFAVPHDPRAQLGEPIRRVATSEHVEHPVEALARQPSKRCRPADQRKQRVDVPSFDRHRSDDLLGQHIERASRVATDLDIPGDDPRGNRCTCK